MDTIYILMWTGYFMFGVALLLTTGYTCWQCCFQNVRRKASNRGNAQPETLSSSATSNSFTYVPTSKSDLIVTEESSNGLAYLQSHLLFDRSDINLSNDEEKEVTFVESRLCLSQDNREMSTLEMSEGNCKQVEVDEHSVDCLADSFDETILSINSSEYDTEYCECPTVLLDNQNQSKFNKKALKYLSFLRRSTSKEPSARHDIREMVTPAQNVVHLPAYSEYV